MRAWVKAATFAALLAASVMTGCTSVPGETWSAGEPPLTTPWTDQVRPGNALPEYPRPQLARPHAAEPVWINLNGLWQFQPWDGYEAIPFGEDLTGQILVPYPMESALSGVGQYSPHALYRTAVDIPSEYTENNRRVRINFGAVNHVATVYVNGQEVVRHSGSYDAFSADITSALHPSGPQEIIVATSSPIDAENIPVGKQRLEPEGIFYTSASGIWQTVWVEPVEELSIASLVAEPDIDSGAFLVSAGFNGDPSDSRLTVTAYADGQRVGSVTGYADSDLQLTVNNPRLWTPGDPFLYTLTATLSGASNDTVESYAGMRRIAVEKVDGRQHIILNGEKTYLLGVLDQGYWPDGIYTAPTDDALRFDIQQAKDLGFNTIRKHVKVEPARWYYWADTLGVLVWQDIPSLPNGRNDTISGSDQHNFRAETARIVAQHQNSPSIIGWVPFNEGWGQWSAQAPRELADHIKAQDPSRLVIARSGSNCCDSPGDPYAGDVRSWHAYQGPAFPTPDAHRAAIDGEHGGLSLPVDGHTWPGVNLDPYGGVDSFEALTQGYVANTAALRDWATTHHMSGSVYTQITDVEIEQNGLFTYDRQVLKVDPDAVRRINRETIVAGSRR